MQKLASFTLLILLLACASPPDKIIYKQTQDNLDSQLEELTDQIVLSLTQQQKAKIAVIEFSNLEGKFTRFGRYLAEELITRLYRTDEFEVIERQMLNKVMAEHSLTLSGMIDENSAKELGRILGVDAIASGSVTDLGNDVKINARLISTETGRVFSVASVKIIKDDVVRRLMDDVVENEPVVKTDLSGKNRPARMVVEEDRFRVELKECILSDRT